MYTTIIHPLRKAYNLSINEYCILESIRLLADNEKYNFWCVGSFQYLADSLDLGRSTIIRTFHSLEQKGLIYKRRNTKQDTAVRCAQEWKDIFTSQEIVLALKNGDLSLLTGHHHTHDTSSVTEVVSKRHQTSVNLIPPSVKMELASVKMTPNINNNINNNTHNNIITLSLEKNSKEKIKEFFKKIESDKETGLISEHDEKYKFYLYWTESNSAGTRQRWELEKTFDIDRRWKKWQNNSLIFQNHGKTRTDSQTTNRGIGAVSTQGFADIIV